MFVVWILTGIWHGAKYTFIAWGLGYFILLVIEKMIIKPSEHKNILFKIIWQTVTLICVNFGWVIFNSSGIKAGIRYCFAMLGYYGTNAVIDADIVYTLHQYGIFIALGLLFSVPIVKILKEKLVNSKFSYISAIAIPVGYGFVFLWAVSFLILGAHNPFIYFNF